MKDMVNLFNQMTVSQSSDNFFTSMINNHYEKFKYLYHLIGCEDVVIISCSESDNEISITIRPTADSYHDVWININNKKNSYKSHDLFVLTMDGDYKEIVLKIKLSHNSKEADIYANRLV